MSILQGNQSWFRLGASVSITSILDSCILYWCSWLCPAEIADWGSRISNVLEYVDL
jgi:hypothetical protein